MKHWFKIHSEAPWESYHDLFVHYDDNLSLHRWSETDQRLYAYGDVSWQSRTALYHVMNTEIISVLTSGADVILQLGCELAVNGETLAGYQVRDLYNLAYPLNDHGRKEITIHHCVVNRIEGKHYRDDVHLFDNMEQLARFIESKVNPSAKS